MVNNGSSILLWDAKPLLIGKGKHDPTKGKTMTTTEPLSIPNAPSFLKDHPKSLVRRMWNLLNETVEEAKECAEIANRYRSGKAEEAALLDSDRSHHETRLYREARARFIDRKKEAHARYEEACKPFFAAYEAEVAELQLVVDEKEAAARKALELANSVTANENNEAIENLAAAAAMAATVVQRLNKQGIKDPQGNDITFKIPTGSTGSRGSSGPRGFTPRFDRITVNNEVMSSHKLLDLATKIDVDRDAVLDMLMKQALNNDKEQWFALDNGSEVSFTVTKTDLDDASKSIVYEISVVKATPQPRKPKTVKVVNEDGTETEVEAPATDDDDDDDDDE